MPPRLSVVVPVHRNRATLLELHERLCRSLAAHADFELVFVDDACPEGSRAVIEALAGRDPRVRLIALERNRGQHEAVLTGLAETRGERALIMDADLQDPPEAIPLLLARADRGDVAGIFAGRRGAYESRSRLFTSRVFKVVNGRLCGLPRDAGLFVLLDRAVIERVLEMRGPPAFLVSMIGLANLPLASIPVERAPRLAGSSAYSFGRRLRSAVRGLAWGVLWRHESLRRVGAHLGR